MHTMFSTIKKPYFTKITLQFIFACNCNNADCTDVMQKIDSFQTVCFCNRTDNLHIITPRCLLLLFPWCQQAVHLLLFQFQSCPLFAFLLPSLS